jgi:hypothetical protein
VHSQNISIKEPRVETLINQKGDTLIQMKLADAKFILAEILDKEIVDSLVNVYMERDAINMSTIQLQVKEIKAMQQKSENQAKQIANLDKMIANKDEEVAILNNKVAEQKKEIRKQKTYKVLGFISAIILPILVLLAI